MVDQGNSAAAAAPEVVTFGESMGLMFPAGGQAGIESAPQFQKGFGGAESNVAIGIARLGHRAGWFGRLGDDPFGRYIYKSIRGEGVDVSRVELSKTAPTGLMLREQTWQGTSVYYYRRGSAASEYQAAHLDEPYIRQAKVLHITGITPALSESCREAVFKAVELARKHQVKVSFDPNLRLKLWSLEEAKQVLLPLAEMADYFLPGLEELQLLYGTENWDAIFSNLKQLRGTSIVKGGKNKTIVVNGAEQFSVSYTPVDRVVDPVGAGDAFCAGFLVGIIKGWELEQAVHLGNMSGSIVIRGYGDWEALPYWEALQALMQNEKHIER